MTADKLDEIAERYSKEWFARQPGLQRHIRAALDEAVAEERTKRKRAEQCADGLSKGTISCSECREGDSAALAVLRAEVERLQEALTAREAKP